LHCSSLPARRTNGLETTTESAFGTCRPGDGIVFVLLFFFHPLSLLCFLLLCSVFSSNELDVPFSVPLDLKSGHLLNSEYGIDLQLDLDLGLNLDLGLHLDLELSVGHVPGLGTTLYFIYS
jgi:hypothetical protein